MVGCCPVLATLADKQLPHYCSDPTFPSLTRHTMRKPMLSEYRVYEASKTFSNS